MIIKNINAESGNFNFTYELQIGCDDKFTFESSANWLTVSTSSTVITVSYSENPNTVSRIGYIIAKVYKQDNSLKCSKEKIKVIQDVAGEKCDCNSVTITGKTNITVEGGSNIIIGEVTAKDKCIDFGTLSSSKPWVHDLSINGNDIKATVDKNTDSNSRDTTIDVPYSANGINCATKQFSITQNGTNCNCDSDDYFKVESRLPSAIDNSGFTGGLLGVISKKGDCITGSTSVVARKTSDIDSDEVNWVTDLTMDGDNINGTVKIGLESNRSAYIHVTVNDGTSYCTKCFEITQKGSICDCDSLIINNNYDGTSDDKFITSGGSDTLIQLGTIDSGECHTNIMVNTATSANWLGDLKLEDNKIMAKVGKITQKGNREGIVHIDYYANSSNCSKEINVYQKGHGCDCSNFALEKSDITIAKNSGTYEINTITQSGVCITDVTATTDATWITAENLVVEENRIKVTVGETESERTATITVSFKADTTECTSNKKTFTVTQGCKIYNISANPTSPGTGGIVEFSVS